MKYYGHIADKQRISEIIASSENQELLVHMQKACLASASEYATEKMADRWFAVLALLNTGSLLDVMSL